MRYIYFWHEYEEYGEFSNWFPSRFVIDDFCYAYVEQYFMAQKAKIFHDSDAYTKILRATSPKECKNIGRMVRSYDRAKWDEVKYGIMKEAVREKFLQNPRLFRKLLSTGDSLLAEASPYDSVWGIGIRAKKIGSQGEAAWKGENLLGRILMEVRNNILNIE